MNPKGIYKLGNTWEDNDIFRKSIEKSNDKNPFIFFEGPPSCCSSSYVFS